MTGPHAASTTDREPQPRLYFGFVSGVRYRVAKTFRDADGDRHRAGTVWTHLGSAVGDGRLVLWVSLDGRREWTVPLVLSQRAEGEVAANLHRYVVEVDPPTAADQMAVVLRETLAAVERSSESAWSVLGPDALAAELRAHLDALRAEGRLAPGLNLRVLFAPTSDFQETSIDNGWGDLYVELASRFDRLLPRLEAEVRRRESERRRLQSVADSRRRAARTVAVWVGGLAAASAGLHAAGVLEVVLAVVAILASLALPAVVALFWLLRDGLWTRSTRKDARRALVGGPVAALRTVALGAVCLGLLYWGARTIADALEAAWPL